jgi:hypothetical protein
MADNPDATGSCVREPARRWVLPYPRAAMVNQWAEFILWWGQTGGMR